MSTLSKREIKRRKKKALKASIKEYNRKSEPEKLVTDYYRPDNHKYHVDGCGVVLLKRVTGKIKILLRFVNNIYYIPKGNRKKGETIFEGAQRELFRYTGIDSYQYTLLPKTYKIEYEQYYQTKSQTQSWYVNKHMHFFFALTDYNEDIPSNNYGSYHWVEIDKVDNEHERNINYLIAFINTII
jgi:hypothetical protein